MLSLTNSYKLLVKKEFRSLNATSITINLREKWSAIQTEAEDLVTQYKNYVKDDNNSPLKKDLDAVEKLAQEVRDTVAKLKDAEEKQAAENNFLALEKAILLSSEITGTTDANEEKVTGFREKIVA